MPIEVKMPRLSDTMEVGTVVKWNVKPGQKVKTGDVLADIETDKATMELQSFDDGTVAALPVGEGQAVKVGTTIMLLAEAGEDPAAVGVPRRSASGPESPDAPTHEDTQPAGKKSRQESEKGVPTGSAAARPDSTGNGRPGTSPGTPVAPRQVPGTQATPTPTTRGAAGPPNTPPSRDRIFASPLARKIAGEAGFDIGAIEGTGPSGRIVRKDVEAALAGGGEGTPAPTRRGDDATFATPSRPSPATIAAGLNPQVIPLSTMRRTIAKRLVESKSTIPHYQVTVSVRMDNLLTLRRQLNEQLASQNIKLSVNDFLVRACALAMHQHPFINSRWVEEPTVGREAPVGRASRPSDQSGSASAPPSSPTTSPDSPAIQILPNINIAIAIALPPERGGGLTVATLRDTDRMGLRQISADSRHLSEKARTRGLTIEEMSDSTFTISNLGMFGVDHFTAIINPPNTAILAVGAAIDKPVINTAPDGSRHLAIGAEMSMTMSSDHRVIDGAMAAQYLATVKELLEKPATLLV